MTARRVAEYALLVFALSLTAIVALLIAGQPVPAVGALILAAVSAITFLTADAEDEARIAHERGN